MDLVERLRRIGSLPPGPFTFLPVFAGLDPRIHAESCPYAFSALPSPLSPVSLASRAHEACFVELVSPCYTYLTECESLLSDVEDLSRHAATLSRTLADLALHGPSLSHWSSWHSTSRRLSLLPPLTSPLLSWREDALSSVRSMEKALHDLLDSSSRLVFAHALALPETSLATPPAFLPFLTPSLPLEPYIAAWQPLPPFPTLLLPSALAQRLSALTLTTPLLAPSSPHATLEVAATLWEDSPLTSPIEALALALATLEA